MNIFAVDHSPTAAAQMLCDQHVSKMTLETAQILSTVAGGPYKPFNPKHPSCLWAKQSHENWCWLIAHGLALAKEFTRRFGKVHKSEAVITEHSHRDAFLPKIGLTDFALCMPDEYKQADTVAAYRAFYRAEKKFAAWNKNRPPPQWMEEA